MQRSRLNAVERNGSSLNGSSATFIPTGCHLLDLALGGGWASGRVINLVGDRSSGKTLLAIEACINFAAMSRPDHIRYGEAEEALDELYAARMGLPAGIGRNKGGELRTVEHFATDLQRFLRTLDGRRPALYVLDSLDALSDVAELGRELGEGSYGTAKAKMLSEFFRKTIGTLSEKNCTLLVVSQIREAIGVMFGEKSRRAGGKALDFYASQIVWLYEVGRVQRTIYKAKRTIGIDVRARVKKNKVALPYREAEFPIMFDYGVDDEMAMLDWLHKNDAMKLLTYPHGDPVKGLIAMRKEHNREGLYALNGMLRVATDQQWQKIESALRPPMRKYEEA